MTTCPNGHDSAATDYCDTCGAAMNADGAPTGVHPLAAEGAGGGAGSAADSSAASGTPADAPEPESTTRPCPHCGQPNSPDALFCEVCGYDHTTGTLPRGADSGAAATSPVEAPANTSKDLATPWVAELWIDPAWYTAQGSSDPLPSQGPPAVFALRNTSLLIGRVSNSRGIHPDIDCGVDNGVSRRHAQLTTDGTRWWVEDLASSNGTYIGDSVGDLPTTSIPTGQKREVDADDRIYVGSWTRIVLRPSSDDEVSALA
ncbi:FHA domain-containing protein [Knoellia sp. CPCC 206453]|uniref:FHA domain-containing protein n=1 Tax=Knoellia pratensis TaxID=3404796 RepID=UPI003624277B